MLRRRLLPVPSAAALVLVAGLSVAPARADDKLECETIPRLVGAFLQNHVHYRALSLELRDRAAETHLARLDPARALLLEKDADELRDRMREVFTALGEQNGCRSLREMHELTIARYRAMEAFVRDYVSREDYAIDPEVELELDPEERGFPRTTEQQLELYRRLIHFQMSNYVSNDTELDEAKQKLIHRYELMTKRAEEMEPEDVYARFLDAFSNSLDPHSDYLSADNFEDFRIHMGLSLEGIGAVLSSRDGYTVVEEVVPGGAADRDGKLEPKDKIIAVGQGQDGELVDVIDMNLRDVVGMIRGKKDSVVRLSILRQGSKTERFNLSLVRAKINLEQQAAKLRFEEVEVGDRTLKLAVIDLPSFYGDKNPANRQASEDVQKLLREVKEAEADGLLLDLSRNGGGLLEYAVSITGLFLGSGGIVAVGDGQDRVQVLRDPDDDLVYDGPLVVLTSRVTASAGEILAGAIKDYRRGVIVGDDHTFGKGSVQTVAPLPTGLGALKLTTALFYRPGGDSTQRKGVSADIVLPSLTARDDFGEVNQKYALPERSIPRYMKPDPKAGKKDGWAEIQTGTVDSLRERSAARVGASDDFAEVAKLLAEALENEGVVRVADLLERARNGGGDEAGDQNDPESGTEAATPGADPAGAKATGAVDGASAMVTPPDVHAAAEKPDEDELTPQAREALQILADLIASQSQVAMN